MVLKGSKVSDVRRLTDEECGEIGLPVDSIGNPYCLVLASGSILFPASDRAMNRSGGWGGDTNSIGNLKGTEIESVSPMSDDYMQYLDWQNNLGEKSVVLTFSNGSDIYTASDPEGNSAGLLFEYKNGETYEITVEQR
jgi:hypothetical protein